MKRYIQALWGLERSRRVTESQRIRTLVFESLEPRLLLSSDPMMVSASDALNVTLSADVVEDGSGESMPVLLLEGTEGQVTISESFIIDGGNAVLEIQGSDAADQVQIDESVLEVFPGLQIRFAGNAGEDTLVVPDGSVWEMLGRNAGALADVIQYQGVENLVGGVFGEETTQLAGNLNEELSWSGVQPLTVDSTDPNNPIIQASAGDDILTVTWDEINSEVVVRDQTNALVGSVDITSISSLTIDGMGGNDSITFAEDLDLAGINLIVNAEAITVSAGVTIEAAQVDLIARAEDVTDVTDVSDLVNRSAQVIIEGTINTTGNITIEANAIRNIHIEAVDLDTDLDLTSSTIANIEIRNTASLDAATVNIVAQTSGEVVSSITGTSGDLGDVTNSFTESATVTVENSTLNVAGVSISAETATTYSATGTSAINSITGSVTVAIEGGTVTAGDGGVTLSAQDNSELTAQAGGIPIALDTLGALDEVDRLGAVNQLNRDVQAYSNAANIQTSGAGNVSLEAVRNARIQATTQAMELTGTLDPELRLNVDIALGGTVAVNTVLGDVSAYIQGGSVSVCRYGGHQSERTGYLSGAREERNQRHRPVWCDYAHRNRISRCFAGV
ncbi:MAG: LEPR-XLL domain-containing protein [bacterium]